MKNLRKSIAITTAVLMMATMGATVFATDSDVISTETEATGKFAKLNEKRAARTENADGTFTKGERPERTFTEGEFQARSERTERTFTEGEFQARSERPERTFTEGERPERSEGTERTFTEGERPERGEGTAKKGMRQAKSSEEATV